MSIDFTNSSIFNNNFYNQVNCTLDEMEKENILHEEFQSNMKEKTSRLNNIIIKLTDESQSPVPKGSGLNS